MDPIEKLFGSLPHEIHCHICLPMRYIDVVNLCKATPVLTYLLRDFYFWRCKAQLDWQIQSSEFDSLFYNNDIFPYVRYIQLAIRHRITPGCEDVMSLNRCVELSLERRDDETTYYFISKAVKQEHVRHEVFLCLCRKGELKFIQYMLRLGSYNVNQGFLEAAQAGNRAVVDYFIANYNVDIGQAIESLVPNSPMHTYLKQFYLVRKTRMWDQIVKTRGNVEQAFINTVIDRDLEVVKIMFIENVIPDVNRGISVAMEQGDGDMVEFLLSLGYDGVSTDQVFCQALETKQIEIARRVYRHGLKNPKQAALRAALCDNFEMFALIHGDTPLNRETLMQAYEIASDKEHYELISYIDNFLAYECPQLELDDFLDL